MYLPKTIGIVEGEGDVKLSSAVIDVYVSGVVPHQFTIWCKHLNGHD
jgi:hypothetical protein